MALLGGIVRGLKGKLKGITLKGTIAGIKKTAGGLTKGGLVGGAVAIGSKIAKRVGRKNMKRAAVAGGVIGAATLMGRGGGEEEGGRRYRRINPGNTRAMRRAIRRIESGARLYSKFFSLKRGGIKGARGVRVKKLSIRRAS